MRPDNGNNSKRFLSRSSLRCRRGGMSLVELLTATVLLMTTMTLVTTASLRVRTVWQTVGRHNLAAAELSNHLERLTVLPLAEATEALKSLTPSDECSTALKEPTLTGLILGEPNLGHRVTLELDWQNNVGRSVQLSGWIVDAQELP